MSARIGLDARSTPQMSVGMKAYARELAGRLPSVAADLEFVSFTRGGNFGWDEQVRLPLALRRARVDVVHFLSLYAPVIVPARYVVTIHDLIHLRFPSQFKGKVGPYYRIVVRRLCKGAARVITDDERTVADLERFLGVDRKRVRVVPLGVEDRFLAPIAASVAPRPYLLYVGNHRAHKNLETLFAAWAGLDVGPLDLYLTGNDDLGGLAQRYARAAGEIRFLGDVDADALAGQYAGARALVHPALAEGFGLPMLEALAARCPVVASEDAAPKALSGAVVTFPPADVEAARAAIARVLLDEGLRAALINEGRARAERLTWERCAVATAQIYREVLEERSR